MGLFQSLAGSLRIQLTSGDPTRLMTELNHAAVTLLDVTSVDMLTIQGTIPQALYPRTKALADKRGAEIQILQRQGLYWDICRLLHRPFLLFGLLLILGLTLFLPSRVLFVRVEGNVNIPTNLILEQAEICGIRFGADRSQVRSEQVKNQLLGKIPGLQWAGINTAGCVATITVRERSVTEQQQSQHGVSSIVASRDGIIQEITVTKGNPLCQVGQAVKAGQVLVSGYTDCGITIKASQAEAEIYALTHRSASAALLPVSFQKGQCIEKRSVYYLVIGKQQYRLYGDDIPTDGSYIWQKTKTEHIITLPGNFQLPVKLVVEEYTGYDAVTPTAAAAKDLLQKFATSYVQSQMVSGKVISAGGFTEETPGRLQMEFSCLEMIGMVRWENSLAAP